MSNASSEAPIVSLTMSLEKVHHHFLSVFIGDADYGSRRTMIRWRYNRSLHQRGSRASSRGELDPPFVNLMWRLDNGIKEVG